MIMSIGPREGETDRDLEYSCKAVGSELVETKADAIVLLQRIAHDFLSLSHHLLKHCDGLFKCPQSSFDIPLPALG